MNLVEHDDLASEPQMPQREMPAPELSERAILTCLLFQMTVQIGDGKYRNVRAIIGSDRRYDRAQAYAAYGNEPTPTAIAAFTVVFMESPPAMELTPPA